MRSFHSFQTTALFVLCVGLSSQVGAQWDPPRQLSFSDHPSELQYNWGWAVDVDGAGVVPRDLVRPIRAVGGGPGLLYAFGGRWPVMDAADTSEPAGCRAAENRSLRWPCVRFLAPCSDRRDSTETFA